MEKTSKIRSIAMGVVFGALYFAITYALAPISYMNIQFRVSEGLKILSVFFGPWAVIGLLIGEMLVNLFSPISAIFDALTPWIGALPGMALMYRWRKNLLRLICGSLIHNVMLSAWVATMLHTFFGFPFYFTWLTVFLGELASVTIFGYALYMGVKNMIPSILRSAK